MSRYIDADALKDKMFNYYDCIIANTGKSNYTGETLMSYEVVDMIEDCIDNAPTADVQEVLRCKDCKFYKVFSGIGHCGVLGICEPDDFCCREERRKDNVEIH